MGGRFDSPKPEHNFTCDPEAAKIVFNSGAPITVTGLEITTTVRLKAGDVARIAEAGEFGQALKAESRAVVAVLERGVEQPARPRSRC